MERENGFQNPEQGTSRLMGSMGRKPINPEALNSPAGGYSSGGATPAAGGYSSGGATPADGGYSGGGATPVAGGYSGGGMTPVNSGYTSSGVAAGATPNSNATPVGGAYVEPNSPSGGYVEPSRPSGGYVNSTPSGGYVNSTPGGGYGGGGYGGGGYGGGSYSGAPRFYLDTSRSLLKYILLSLVTCGIYGIIVMSSISTDINTIASKHDGKRTMHYCLLYFLVNYVTCGIGSLVWYHNLSSRMGDELRRRGIDYSFSAADFWLWCILGSFIIVGPFVFCHKQLKAMNLLCEHYNIHG